MNDNNDILNEIKEISPLLASLKGANIFSVPQGYFNMLYDKIESSIRVDFLNTHGTKLESPQSVPEGYFDDLSVKILQNIKTIEGLKTATEEDILPVNLITDKKNVFTAPEGYFKNLPAEVLVKIKRNDSETRVISIFRKPVIRYATAAAIAIILLLTGFYKLGNNAADNGFAVVNKNTVPFADALQYNSEKAFEKGIESLSDQQIIIYLEKNGDIFDNQFLIDNTNPDEMPDPIDYLEDEKALDNYLNSNLPDGNKKY